jgi:hypothetical protein
MAGQGAGGGGHHARKTASFVLLESDNSMTSPMKTNALLAGLHDKLRSMQVSNSWLSKGPLLCYLLIAL